MRIRKKKWAQRELEGSDIFIADPVCVACDLDLLFDDSNDIVVEIGCGKGVFLSEYAPHRPKLNFVGVDVKRDMLAVAHRNITSAYLKAGLEPFNIRLIPFDARWIGELFRGSAKAAEIIVNFPNPWPKERHKKRRLTHPRQLVQYAGFLADEAILHFKTDDSSLFYDTVGYLGDSGFEIVCSTEDYYADVPDDERYPPGEHERLFLDRGLPVRYIKAKKRCAS